VSMGSDEVALACSRECSSPCWRVYMYLGVCVHVA
jgi:hypothetical protein